jgi:hypothetical protein
LVTRVPGVQSAPVREKMARQMNTRLPLLTIFLASSIMSAASQAHHSTAEFDYTRAYLVEGTVKEFQWTNPHSWVQVLVPNEQGGTDEWGFELGAPLFNIRMGWKSNSVAAGDHVKVLFCPSRTRARGTLMRLILPGGSVLNGIANNFYRGAPIADPDRVARPPPLDPVS